MFYATLLIALSVLPGSCRVCRFLEDDPELFSFTSRVASNYDRIQHMRVTHNKTFNPGRFRQEMDATFELLIHPIFLMLLVWDYFRSWTNTVASLTLTLGLAAMIYYDQVQYLVPTLLWTHAAALLLYWYLPGSTKVRTFSRPYTVIVSRMWVPLSFSAEGQQSSRLCCVGHMLCGNGTMFYTFCEYRLCVFCVDPTGCSACQNLPSPQSQLNRATREVHQIPLRYGQYPVPTAHRQQSLVSCPQSADMARPIPYSTMGHRMPHRRHRTHPYSLPISLRRTADLVHTTSIQDTRPTKAGYRQGSVLAILRRLASSRRLEATVLSQLTNISAVMLIHVLMDGRIDDDEGLTGFKRMTGYTWWCLLLPNQKRCAHADAEIWHDCACRFSSSYTTEGALIGLLLHCLAVDVLIV